MDNIHNLEIALCTYSIKDKSLSFNKHFEKILSEFKNDEKLIKLLQELIEKEQTEQRLGFFETVILGSEEYFVNCYKSKDEDEKYYYQFNKISDLNSVSPALPYIKKAENDYLSILESLHSDFVITDSKGIVTHVLPSFESFYGVPIKKIKGESVYTLEQQGILNPSIVAKSLESGEPVTMLQYTKSKKYLMCSAIPIKNVKGEIIRVVSFSRDVTQYELLKQEYDNLRKDMDYYTAEIDRIKKIKVQIPETVGKSKEIQQIICSVERISKFDSVVLLTGESGVGKTMYAKMIHEQSNRSEKPFVEINCGAIPSSLFESEFFGYVKGAFTGANPEGKKGWIENAEGGTLFLDEIADLPSYMQVKLLKTLDTNNIIPVGGTKPVHVDFRLITATNKNLEEMVKTNEFREDLFYRLNVITLNIPALRDHREDIFTLIMHFLKKNKEKYGIAKEFSSRAIEIMMKYNWPGNIRELENVVERLYLTVDEYVINEDDLPSYMKSQLNTDYLNPGDASLPEILKNVEKEIIMKCYNKHKNTTKVAKELGISQPSVSIKIKKYQEDENVSS